MLHIAFAEPKNSTVGGAEVDSEQDGLTDNEEADYALHPNSTNTDGDGTVDGLDGWAGSKTNIVENAVQAQLAPERLPIARYALIDFGLGSGGVLNQKGDMLYYSPSASWVFLNGQKIQIQVPQELSNCWATDINELGHIMGVGSTGTEFRLFKWTNNQSHVMQPFEPYQLRHDIYTQNQKTFTYPWAGLTASGEIWALQAYFGGKSGTSDSGYVDYSANFHDIRFGNLKPTNYSPSYIAYEEYIHGSYNQTGNPPSPTNVPPSEYFYLNTYTNSWGAGGAGLGLITIIFGPGH